MEVVDNDEVGEEVDDVIKASKDEIESFVTDDSISHLAASDHFATLDESEYLDACGGRILYCMVVKSQDLLSYDQDAS